MSYDENRMSDQINGGLNEKEQMQKQIEELESKLKEAEKHNKELEEKILNEMQRRFNLQYDDLDKLPIDDTQLGVEFVIEFLNQQDNKK